MQGEEFLGELLYWFQWIRHEMVLIDIVQISIAFSKFSNRVSTIQKPCQKFMTIEKQHSNETSFITHNGFETRGSQ